MMEKIIFKGLLLVLFISTVMWIAEKNTTDDGRSEAGDAAQQPPEIDHYIVYDNATVKDTETGLLWMRCSVGQTWNGSDCDGEPQAMTWAAAMKVSIDFAGHKDWQLPTIEELAALTYCSSKKPKLYPGYQQKREFCRGHYQRPTINTAAFPVPQNYRGHEADEWYNLLYWSSTTYPYYKDSAWAVNFHSGFNSDVLKHHSGYVRLVRREP